MKSDELGEINDQLFEVEVTFTYFTFSFSGANLGEARGAKRNRQTKRFKEFPFSFKVRNKQDAHERKFNAHSGRKSERKSANVQNGEKAES